MKRTGRRSKYNSEVVQVVQSTPKPLIEIQNHQVIPWFRKSPALQQQSVHWRLAARRMEPKPTSPARIIHRWEKCLEMSMD